MILRHVGQTEEAFRLAARAVELSGDNPWMLTNLATSYAQAGERERASAILRELEENPVGRYILPGRLVGVYVSLGDYERALDELEKAFAVRDPLLIWITSDPGVDPLRGYQRFVDIQRRIKNYAK